jgi:hypothetical protein
MRLSSWRCRAPAMNRGVLAVLVHLECPQYSSHTSRVPTVLVLVLCMRLHVMHSHSPSASANPLKISPE